MMFLNAKVILEFLLLTNVKIKIIGERNLSFEGGHEFSSEFLDCVKKHMNEIIYYLNRLC